jgi:Fe-S-cluster containining protein
MIRRPKLTPGAAPLPEEPILKEASGFENNDLCSACKGQCCKHIPGATHPSDWKSQRALASALMAMSYSIDAWENTRYEDIHLDKVYYVRPAVVCRSHEVGVYDLSWGGPCVFLEDTGCRLQLPQRPLQCRMLEPRSGFYGRGTGHCWGHVSRRQTVLAWLPYQRVLQNVGAQAVAWLQRQKRINCDGQ